MKIPLSFKIQLILLSLIYLTISIYWIFGHFGPYFGISKIGLLNLSSDGKISLILTSVLINILPIFAFFVIFTSLKNKEFFEYSTGQIIATFSIIFKLLLYSTVFFFVNTDFTIKDIAIQSAYNFPIFERFLSLQEIFKMGLFLGLLFFIFTFLIEKPENIFIRFKKVSNSQILLNNSFIIIFFLITIFIGIISIAINQAIDRLLVLIINASANNFNNYHEDPNSSGLPAGFLYYIFLCFGFLMSIGIAIFSLLIYPYIILKKTLKYIQDKISNFLF